jgi:hypothetical protein
MTLQSTLSLAKENFRQTLAGAASFWSFCGVADMMEPAPPEQKTDAAIQHIYLEGLPRPADGADSYAKNEFAAYHPCAVIFTNEENGLSLDVYSAEHQATGALKARFYAIVPPQDVSENEPTADAKAAFEDSIGLIINELHDLALEGQAALAMTKISLARGPFWYDPKETPVSGCRMGAELSIEWCGR